MLKRIRGSKGNIVIIITGPLQIYCCYSWIRGGTRGVCCTVIANPVAPEGVYIGNGER